MDQVKRSLGLMLRDADVAMKVEAGDDGWLSQWLDRHPFLLKQAASTPVVWKPGFNTGAIRRD